MGRGEGRRCVICGGCAAPGMSGIEKKYVPERTLPFQQSLGPWCTPTNPHKDKILEGGIGFLFPFK